MSSCVPSPIVWENGKLLLLDQRLLPHEERMVVCATIEEAHDAIRDMVVRGAPCIGFTAIYGLALWLKEQRDFSWQRFCERARYLKGARPTAVNLMFEVDRVVALVEKNLATLNSAALIYEFVVKDGDQQIARSVHNNTRMAELALSDLTRRYGERPLTFMTHCNTGFLACGTLGTALGVISHAHSKGRVEMVYADETRPYMQGSRLTAYELSKEGIPHQLVVEGAASYLMTHHKIDAIFVGADRIAANGDTANKVGTSTLAIVARHYGVPFYVVAPMSSFDYQLASGREIEIELRHEDEILSYKGQRVAPAGTRALNPSFDVTQASLISGIISETGLVLNPTTASMRALLGEKA